MPTYVYACETCGEFEQKQSMTEAALAACPTCGAPVRRMISGGSGFIMRGSRTTPNVPPCGDRAASCAAPMSCCGSGACGHSH